VPEQSELYLFHGPGHPLGLQTHDVYDRQRAFEPNMVFTNQPGVYVRKDDVVASEVFKKLTASEQQSLRGCSIGTTASASTSKTTCRITRGEPRSCRPARRAPRATSRR